MGLKNRPTRLEAPRSTLKNKVNSKEIDIEKLITNRLGRKPVLPYNLQELVSYCLMMERKFVGLTTRSIKRKTFVLAIKNGLTCPLSVQEGRAGWKWLRNFMSPSSTEVAQAPSYLESESKGIHENKGRNIFRHI
jgi:hypothetical protein